MRPATLLLLLCLLPGAWPPVAFGDAAYMCAVDRDGDGDADAEGETAECVASGSTRTCPIDPGAPCLPIDPGSPEPETPVTVCTRDLDGDGATIGAGETAACVPAQVCPIREELPCRDGSCVEAGSCARETETETRVRHRCSVDGVEHLTPESCEASCTRSWTCPRNEPVACAEQSRQVPSTVYDCSLTGASHATATACASACSRTQPCSRTEPVACTASTTYSCSFNGQSYTSQSSCQSACKRTVTEAVACTVGTAWVPYTVYGYVCSLNSQKFTSQAACTSGCTQSYTCQIGTRQVLSHWEVVARKFVEGPRTHELTYTAANDPSPACFYAAWGGLAVRPECGLALAGSQQYASWLQMTPAGYTYFGSVTIYGSGDHQETWFLSKRPVYRSEPVYGVCTTPGTCNYQSWQEGSWQTNATCPVTGQQFQTAAACASACTIQRQESGICTAGSRYTCPQTGQTYTSSSACAGACTRTVQDICTENGSCSARTVYNTVREWFCPETGQAYGSAEQCGAVCTRTVDSTCWEPGQCSASEVTVEREAFRCSLDGTRFATADNCTDACAYTAPCAEQDLCPFDASAGCAALQGGEETVNLDDSILLDDGRRDPEGLCLDQVRLFEGRAMDCRKAGFHTGFKSCCKDGGDAVFHDSTGSSAGAMVSGVGAVRHAWTVGSGAWRIWHTADWGGVNMVGYSLQESFAMALDDFLMGMFDPYSIAISVAIWVVTELLMQSCDQMDLETSMLRGSGYCHELGDYCKKKWFGKWCVQKAKAHCCFNSKLARIIHEQGRAQLEAKPWGQPKHPRCEGFSPEEFRALDFSTLDLSEYYGDIQARAMELVGEDLMQGMDRFYRQVP